MARLVAQAGDAVRGLKLPGREVHSEAAEAEAEEARGRVRLDLLVPFPMMPLPMFPSMSCPSRVAAEKSLKSSDES